MNFSEITRQFASAITVTDVTCLVGLILFGCWLLKTSLGRKALANSAPRLNNMAAYVPFIPLFIWFGAVPIAISITRKLLPDLADWQSVFADNLIFCAGAMAGLVVIIFLARASFTRRLKGFGLNPKTIFKDFFAGAMNLFSVWPLVMFALILTIFFGRLIWGPDFQLQQHEELELITAHPQLAVRVLIIVIAAVIAPAFEEMLFRGLFQTMLRSFLQRPWLSIAISSALFAIVHTNIGHWPVLFVLAICLGYSYEKSGSLFRPIFIHSLFNAISIISVLYNTGSG